MGVHLQNRKPIIVIEKKGINQHGTKKRKKKT
jgi:hypothetical protein